jgi:hypothetical protein
VFFDIDIDIIGYEYSVRARISRAIKHSQILWVYLHGMKLEKGKESYWICKQCYDVGKSKVLTAGSTGGISRHPNTHSVYAPCTTPSGGNTVDAFLEGQHPLQAERRREHFKPFETATKRAEGNAITGTNGVIWEVIPIIDYLFTTIQKHADEVTATPHLFTDHYQHCINQGERAQAVHDRHH